MLNARPVGIHDVGCERRDGAFRRDLVNRDRAFLAAPVAVGDVDISVGIDCRIGYRMQVRCEAFSDLVAKGDAGAAVLRDAKVGSSRLGGRVRDLHDDLLAGCRRDLASEIAKANFGNGCSLKGNAGALDRDFASRQEPLAVTRFLMMISLTFKCR